MVILALDLGTKTGWAANAAGVVTSGVQRFESGRFEGGGMRYLRFTRWLDETRALGVTEVHFEEVRRHVGTTAAHVYGGFLAHLTAWCEQHSIPYSGTSVGTIKKHVTGKGNASKQEMIVAVRALGYDPVDDNEADALALLLMVTP